MLSQAGKKSNKHRITSSESNITLCNHEISCLTNPCYKLKFAEGTEKEGKTDSDGLVKLKDVPATSYKFVKSPDIMRVFEGREKRTDIITYSGGETVIRHTVTSNETLGSIISKYSKGDPESFQNKMDYKLPEGTSAEAVWKREGNKKPGGVAYKKKNELPGGRNKVVDDPDYIYPGEFVEIPIILYSIAVKPEVTVSTKKKKTLVVYVHGMSAKTRSAESGYYYPEIYFSHPNHDAVSYVKDNEFWVKTLPRELMDEEYIKKLGDKNRFHINMYDMYKNSQETEKDRNLKSGLRYAVYRMKDGDMEKDFKDGCDVMMPEYNGHLGFMLGAMEVCDQVYDWAFMRQGTDGECGYEKIIMIAHSMGGLVARAMLGKITDVEKLAKMMNIKYEYYKSEWKTEVKDHKNDWIEEEKGNIRRLFNDIRIEEDAGGDMNAEGITKRYIDDLADKRVEEKIKCGVFKLDYDKKASYIKNGMNEKDIVYTEKSLERLVERFKMESGRIQGKVEKLITLGTPHEGSGVSSEGLPYLMGSADNNEAAYHMTPWFMKSLNDRIMTPQSVFDRCTKLDKFVVAGGRSQYGSPLYFQLPTLFYKVISAVSITNPAGASVLLNLGLIIENIKMMKTNEMSYDQKFWRVWDEAYDPIKENDLSFFNRVGKHDTEKEKDVYDYLDDSASGWFYEGKLDDQVEINGQKKTVKNYAIDCDSAVRLDSALLYHYWDKLKTSGKFPDPSSTANRDKQTLVLTHADLKAPVIKNEICANPTKEWENRMLNKIGDDNDNLMTFIKDIIGGAG